VNFTDTEFSTMSNALRVAAERFADHAKECGIPRLREQFEKQERECRALYGRIADENGAAS